ncbi:hypothetical protein MPDQ_001636 [Monascus purpureus]|uniref:Eisosome protein 1 n=1 Tax=Monascus purpureus TaxID=5098 RepID=A0A507QM64_MONPU|nr:hypothetical protein MPDQ_001636 [Monascus purpureus]BDD60571.1 hypothetical protein MAP00_005693 [Monascus purpureus]
MAGACAKRGCRCCDTDLSTGPSADHAASAALYVTHPERRIAVREPDVDIFGSGGTGFSPSHNRASASAAAILAHTKSRAREPSEIRKEPGVYSSTQHIQDYYASEIRDGTPLTPEGFHAALSAARDRRSLASLPSLPVGVRPDLTKVEEPAERSRTPSPDGGALRAATGAFSISRKRADSAPTKPARTTDSVYALSAAGLSHKYRVEPEGPFDNLDRAVEASRIQHVADPNPKLYTSTPPVALEVEEVRRNDVLRAAATSMAREMYPISVEKTDRGSAIAVSAAQVGHDRMRPHEPTATEDPSAAFKRALNLQGAAQKIASEKLARMQYQDLYHDYYGTGQPARSRLSIRLKRTPSDIDASKVDNERSKEIRRQMASLQTRLDKLDERRRIEQDEKRQKDRDELMEVARRNVHATMHDLETKVYAEKGLPTPAQQREWEEAAQERVRLEREAQLAGSERVLIGADQYVDRADVEAVARARIQPTLDEITDRTSEQKAKEFEQHLDREEMKRRVTREREREADTRAEEKRLRDFLKREAKEKSRLRRSKSKKTRQEPAAEKDIISPRTSKEEENVPSEVSHEARSDATRQGDTEEESATGAVSDAAGEQAEVSQAQAAPEEAAPPPKKESRIRAWFRGRRSSGTHRAVETASEEKTESVPEPSEAGADTPLGADGAPYGDARLAPLGSHPVRSRNGIEGLENGNQSNGHVHKFEKTAANGEPRQSRKDIYENEAKALHNGSEGALDANQASIVEQEALRDSAIHQGLPVPLPIGTSTSAGSHRESRFSEEL